MLPLDIISATAELFYTEAAMRTPYIIQHYPLREYGIRKIEYKDGNSVVSSY